MDGQRTRELSAEDKMHILKCFDRGDPFGLIAKRLNLESFVVKQFLQSEGLFKKPYRFQHCERTYGLGKITPLNKPWGSFIKKKGDGYEYGD